MIKTHFSKKLNNLAERIKDIDELLLYDELDYCYNVDDGCEPTLIIDLINKSLSIKKPIFQLSLEYEEFYFIGTLQELEKKFKKILADNQETCKHKISQEIKELEKKLSSLKRKLKND